MLLMQSSEIQIILLVSKNNKNTHYINKNTKIQKYFSASFLNALSIHAILSC